jgi:excisionase family DNA binding protein
MPHQAPTSRQALEATSIPPLLTRQDAAKALASCLRTVDEAIASGAIEIVHIGRSVRIQASALERFIEARTTRRNPRRAARKATKKPTSAAQ